MSNTPNLCALDGCEEEVSPLRVSRGAKYHADVCRKKNAGRRYTRGESGHRDGTARSLDEQVQQEKDKLETKEMKRSLLELTRSAAKRGEYVAAIQSALSSYEPSIVFPLEEQDGQTAVNWALMVSDWHIGQATTLEHTGGMYEQTLAVTREQVDRLLSAVSSIFYESRGKTVKNLWVPILGDIVEGDSMRPAQLREIELPVVKQTVEGFDLLAYFLNSLLQLPGLENLYIDLVGGNHDRTTTKAGNAGLGETDFVDTFAWLIGAMLQRRFEDDPRVTIKNWETFFGTREFAGLRHVFEHGASIRTSGGSYGGIPWYPIANAARKYSEMLGGVDMVWFGHQHTPYVIPLGQQGHIIGNGSLPATSRFVQSSFKSIRRPQQWLVEFHRKHGATAFRPLYADIDLPAPGAVWDTKQLKQIDL
jgi:hypothetical protein